MNEEINEGLDNFTHYSSLLSTLKDIVSLVNKEALGLSNTISQSIRDSLMSTNL
jgi:hypothetical protein